MHFFEVRKEYERFYLDISQVRKCKSDKYRMPMLYVFPKWFNENAWKFVQLNMWPGVQGGVVVKQNTVISYIRTKKDIRILNRSDVQEILTVEHKLLRNLAHLQRIPVSEKYIKDGETLNSSWRLIWSDLEC